MIAAVLSTLITLVVIVAGWAKNWIKLPERPDGSPSEHAADIHIRKLFSSLKNKIRISSKGETNSMSDEDLEKVSDRAMALSRSSKQPRQCTDSCFQHQETFQAVIMAFSDQQLVTGLALLIATYIKGDVTVYTFQVASTVAWFSTTTHLATLVVLKESVDSSSSHGANVQLTFC
jgi:hypothetical protein